MLRKEHRSECVNCRVGTPVCEKYKIANESMTGFFCWGIFLLGNEGYTCGVGAQAHEASTRSYDRLAIELPGFQRHRHQSGSDSGRYQRQPTMLAPKSPPVNNKVQ